MPRTKLTEKQKDLKRLNKTTGEEKYCIDCGEKKHRINDFYPNGDCTDGRRNQCKKCYDIGTEAKKGRTLKDKEDKNRRASKETHNQFVRSFLRALHGKSVNIDFEAIFGYHVHLLVDKFKNDYPYLSVDTYGSEHQYDKTKPNSPSNVWRWNVDIINSRSNFKLSKPDEVKECYELSNIDFIWAHLNH